nr:hypothetical protein [Evansella caseinilytica]
MRKNKHTLKSTDGNITSSDKYPNHRLHYQVYLQEDRPSQPKEEDEIEY